MERPIKMIERLKQGTHVKVDKSGSPLHDMEGTVVGIFCQMYTQSYIVDFGKPLKNGYNCSIIPDVCLRLVVGKDEI